MVAYIKPFDKINTSINAEITTSPTNDKKGIATITTPYANDAYNRSQFNNVFANKWYRSTNGEGYIDCNSYNGSFTNDGTTLLDANIELGANSYTYYAELINSTWLGNEIVNSGKITIYSAPYAPLDVKISGPNDVVTGQDVTLTGSYKIDNKNVVGNIIKQEYKWQKLNPDTGEWIDIAGSGKLTYKPSTSTTGSTGYRFCVRTAGKGGQFSEWAPSANFEVRVGEYDSPLVSVGDNLEAEAITGTNLNLSATVTNSTYYDTIEYQWYYLNPDGIYLRFKNNSWGGYTFSNTDTQTITIARSTETSEPLKVRCQVTGVKNGYKKVSNSEDISVSFINLPVPTIKTQPQGANLVKSNTSHAISVSATSRQGEPTYQWQVSNDGNTWENIQGETNYNYLVDRNTATNGIYYRCIVSNAAGSVNSDSAFFVIKDGTVLNAKLNSGLSARFVEGNQNYTIDNDNRTLTCHLGDVLLMGYDTTEGNATTFEKTLGTDWRNRTGLNSNGMGEWYLDTSMAGTFEYYGRFYAEYDDGIGHIQTALYDRGNDERMRYTVIVLPNEDTIDISPISVELGQESESIMADYQMLFTTGGVSTTANTNFRGNHKASSYYHFVSGYRLFMGIPNSEGEIEYICVKESSFYDDENDLYQEMIQLSLDTSAQALSNLGIETLDGTYDAYIVMDYQTITNEDVEGQFIVKRHSYQGHQFTITVVAPCTHEHTTTTYTFDYNNPQEPTIYYTTTCDECGVATDAHFYRIYEESSSGLPIISKAATCEEDGLKEHKHFEQGGYDIYYVKDSNNKWVVCEDPSTLTIQSGHNYKSVEKLDPTCTEDGHKPHYECTICHKTYIKNGETYYEVSAEDIVLSAYHKNLEVYEEVKATCSTYGTKAYYKCSNCGKFFSDNAGEHEITDLSAWKESDGRIEKIPHTFEWVVDTPATKTTTGIKHEECSVCHEKRNENTIIPIIDCEHAHVNKTDKVAPTCETAGKEAYWYCEDCKKYFSDENCQLVIDNINSYGVINALGHSWGDWVVVRAATETEDGLERRTCLNDPSHTEERAITSSGYHYTTDESGTKVFEGAFTEGTPSDLSQLFNAAKTQSGKVSVKSGDVTLVFDAKAVAQIGGNAANLTLCVNDTNITIENAELVIEISLGATTFENGSVHVKVPFNKEAPSGKQVKVYYVNGNNKTDMNATYANGYVEFDTNHFSTFIVVFEDANTAPVNPVEPTKKGLSAGAVVGIVIGSIVVLAGLGVGCFFILKKKGVISNKANETQKEEPKEESKLIEETPVEDTQQEPETEAQEETTEE